MLPESQVLPPAQAQVEKKALDLVGRTNALQIVDAASLAVGAELRGALKDMKKAAKEVFDPVCEAAKKAHTAATQARAKVIDPIDAATSRLDGAMSRYQMAQEAEARRLRDAAAAKAREAAETETLERASRLADAGLPEAADAVLERPVALSAPALAATPPAPAVPEGIAFVERWSFEILDAEAIPRAFLMPNETKIGQTVRALKGEAAGVLGPGVRVIVEKRPMDTRRS